MFLMLRSEWYTPASMKRRMVFPMASVSSPESARSAMISATERESSILSSSIEQRMKIPFFSAIAATGMGTGSPISSIFSRRAYSRNALELSGETPRNRSPRSLAIMPPRR